MPQRLMGRRALVTGAGQDIGRMVALQLAREGAQLVATDDDAASLRPLRDMGMTTRALDASDPAAVQSLASEFPDIDILANVARWDPRGNILACAEGDWNKAFDVNVKSAYCMIRAFLPSMIEAGRGSIINTSSVYSSTLGHADKLAWGASQAAVIGLTKSVAMAHAHQNVRCNVVCLADAEPGLDAPTGRAPTGARLYADYPAGRLPTLEEVAAMFVYLASEEASFTTGAVMVVDGGYSLLSKAREEMRQLKVITT